MKAQRYAERCRPEIVKEIGELPYLSFEEARNWYWMSVPKLLPAEKALLGANDRFFLLTWYCGRVDAVHEWVYDRCREVEAEPDGYLDLWARGHYKSSIITFAGSIQEIIHDPEITIGIFGNSAEISRPFLTQIMHELENNETLKKYYPDVLWTDPRKQAPRWSVRDGIVVKRKGNPKEATIEAHGLIDSMPTGRHWPLRIYDDTVTEKSVTSPEIIIKTTARWELSQNLGAGDKGSRMWTPGTRYSFADTYGVLIERRSLKVRLHPATDNGKLDGKPVFLSEEQWERTKRDQRSTVAAQMLLNPAAGEENTFLIEWLRPYELRPTLLNVYIIGDPSLGRTATSDRTAIAVIGVDSQNNRYLLDGYCHRMRLSDRWKALKDLHQKWKKATGVQSVFVGWERYGLQSDTEYFDEQSLAEKTAIPIDEVHWVKEGPQSKKARVGRLEPYFRNSQFWVPSNVWVNGKAHTWVVNAETSQIEYTPKKGESRAERAAKGRGETYRIPQPIRRMDEDGNPYDLFRVFVEEFAFFPFSPRDDLIDAMSRIEDMKPVPPTVVERISLRQREWSDA